MVKKLFSFVAFSFLSLSQLDCSCDFLTEAKASYYYFTSSRTREVYTGSGLYSIELSLETWSDLYAWLSAGYLHASGRTKADNHKTTLQMVPLNFGIKYMPCWEKYHPYVGLGLSATYMHTEDDSPYVIQNNDKWGVGVIGKLGFLAYMTECMFLDLFMDYTYVKVCFNKTPPEFVVRRDADLSGIAFGAGIGWNF